MCLIFLLQLQILVLVGYPGSGKSFLANQIEKKSAQRYVAVCRDILGSWQKCAAKATELIKVGIFNIIMLFVTNTYNPKKIIIKKSFFTIYTKIATRQRKFKSISLHR